MHNYFGNNSTTQKAQVENARSEIIIAIKDYNFILIPSLQAMESVYQQFNTEKLNLI